MNYFIIDRFEGEIAVCENQSTKQFVNILRSLIDSNAKEGDAIFFTNEGYKISTKETNKNKKDILALLEENSKIN